MAIGGRFGAIHKKRRIALGKTLRQFCLENGLDPGNTSRLERGRLQPLQGVKLQERARMLKLEKGSNEWHEFFDLAAAERGTIPDDLLSDEEVVAKLPILFRSLRGRQPTEEDLDELVRKLRET